ncbi:hypothetical protein Pmani_005074 [Petrolisthes manimaculis]|uniref:Myb/SANT-like DNA-binding domain-containing protein n=1 Tax=Petrolisthes manimaculis TaxID=1843537 RepID=A0AAE1QCB7_9EUCA|nr:hypothetical protein Pmani_005074 [Petrolisthes manimaculis]
MNGAVKWSDESTREFIQLRYKLRHLFNGRKHHCEKAYSRIVSELGLTRIITPTQARKKWSNLLQKYMDIKGGYSTSTADWPYFQILDQIVPLMRKEKIEKLPPSNVESRDLDQSYDDGLHSPLTNPSVSENDPLTSSSDPLAVPSVSMVTSVTSESSSSVTATSKCKTEVMDESEPPRKRGRGRRAAQRARDRWWGAVEDEDLGTDSLGKSEHLLTTNGQGAAARNLAYNNLDPSHMELQTFKMLESCASALGDIKNVLTTHSSHQETLIQNLQQTVVNQGNTMKELLTTLTSQNATLISIISQLADKTSNRSNLVMERGGSYGDHNKHQSDGRSSNTTTSHHQLLASQANLISALSQDSQDCDNSLVDNPVLDDNMAGL